MPCPPPAFGLLLKRYRRAAGWTQEELAERSGLSVRGISDLERGARVRPHRDTIELLADALALSADDRAALGAVARVKPRPSGLLAIPIPPTSLIGRDLDLATICQIVEQTGPRLITLTGPGGVGKTRLALRVAAELRSRFPDGVVFVPLAALRDPALVLATIAHTLGLADTNDRPPLERLVAHLRPRRVLLVLDNVEHLLAATPRIGQLLAGCPDLHILATSRTVLHLSDEQEFVVPPLAIPATDPPVDIEALLQSPSVALFVERMRTHDPRFDLTEPDAASVATICGRTDGLPLAIELAAASGRYFTLPELARRLERRLPILTHGPRDLPARQWTLRATIAWSYDLLPPEAQRLFRWLSVFAGGWTAEHAEALCRGVDGMPREVIDGLATLVDSSLVRVERGTDGQTRYEMLETIREFAEEQMIVNGEEESVRRRHADVMLAFTDQAERGLQSGERTAWGRACRAEIDNVRAALRWSLDHDETERALCIVGNLDWFWDAVARDREGFTWSKAALAKENADHAGWGYARALDATGALAWNMGEFAMSARLLTESVARFRELGDRRSLGRALVNLGLTVHYLGDTASARQMMIEAVAIFETMREPWLLGLARFGLGETLVASDLNAAQAAYEQSLTVFREVNDPWGIALATAGLGGVAMRQREYADAQELMEEALALRQEIGHANVIGFSLASLGELARYRGDHVRSATHLTDALKRFRQAGDTEHIAWTLYNLGLSAIACDDREAAQAALKECLTLRTEQGNAREIAKTLAGVARLAELSGDLDCAATLWGAVTGIRATQGLSDPQDQDEDGQAEHLARERIAAALGAEAANRALAHGQCLPMPEAIRLAQAALSSDAVRTRNGAGALPTPPH